MMNAAIGVIKKTDAAMMDPMAAVLSAVASQVTSPNRGIQMVSPIIHKIPWAMA